MSQEDNKALIARFEAGKKVFAAEREIERKGLLARLTRVKEMTVKCTELVALQKETITTAPKIVQKQEKLLELYRNADLKTAPGTRPSPKARQIHANIQKIQNSRIFGNAKVIQDRIQTLVIMLDQSQCKVLRNELLMDLAKKNAEKFEHLRVHEFSTIATKGMIICTAIRRDIAKFNSQTNAQIFPGTTKTAADKYHACLKHNFADSLAATEKAYADAITNITFGCNICAQQEDFFPEPVTTPCNHIFHQKCLLEWLKRSNTCPTCRGLVTVNDVY